MMTTALTRPRGGGGRPGSLVVRLLPLACLIPCSFSPAPLHPCNGISCTLAIPRHRGPSSRRVRGTPSPRRV
jgi:hypothetical protein